MYNDKVDKELDSMIEPYKELVRLFENRFFKIINEDLGYYQEIDDSRKGEIENIQSIIAQKIDMINEVIENLKYKFNYETRRFRKDKLVDDSNTRLHNQLVIVVGSLVEVLNLLGAYTSGKIYTSLTYFDAEDFIKNMNGLVNKSKRELKFLIGEN